MTTSDPSRPSRVRCRKDSDRYFMESEVRGKHEVRIDEGNKSPPVGSGQDWYPNPVDYMLLSLAACQVAVLTQCLARAGIEEFDIAAEANDVKRRVDAIPEEMPEHTGSRLEQVEVDIELTVPDGSRAAAERCLEVYDEGCIVGQSFRSGIDYTPLTSLTVE